MRKPKLETVVVKYNGHTFVKDKRSGYYLSSKPIGLNGKRIHLHRYIWEVEKGPIPEGYVVHHIDGNKENNCIENYRLETAHEHASHHAKDKCNSDPDCAKKFVERTNEKSKAWHKSEEGHKWHVEHAKTSICKPQKMVTMVCQNCGKEYQVGESYAWKSKYCCRNCKATARRRRVKANESAESKIG